MSYVFFEDLIDMENGLDFVGLRYANLHN